MNDNQRDKPQPVTIGDLKRGGHMLLLCCLNMPYCSASEVVDPGKCNFQDGDALPDLGKRYKLTCERCGHIGFEARPMYPRASGSI